VAESEVVKCEVMVGRCLHVRRRISAGGDDTLLSMLGFRDIGDDELRRLLRL
jgi:hypothetical protein